jgi:lipopolysaccharide export LptBFGC system permease protein LptF
MKRQRLWMAISGMTGLSFFLIANFTSLFSGASVIAGILQLGVNAFVFVVWGKAFKQSSGLQKFVAFWGAVVPIVMALITTVRVLLPLIKH